MAYSMSDALSSMGQQPSPQVPAPQDPTVQQGAVSYTNPGMLQGQDEPDELL